MVAADPVVELVMTWEDFNHNPCILPGMHMPRY